MPRAPKLWIQTDERCRAGKLKLLHGPTQVPCTLVNLYLASMRNAGTSATSVDCYATQLSTLIRYMALAKRSVWEIDDDWLCNFGKWLSKSKQRKAKQTNRIIHQTLTYLAWIQRFVNPSPRLIGEFGTGSRVTVIYRTTPRQRSSAMWHESLQATEIGAEIEPMTRTTFLALYDASSVIARSKYVVARTRILLSAYYDTGARRCELCNLMVRDVLEACERSDGRIRIATAKRRGPHSRLVPIPRTTLDQMLAFVRVARAKLIDDLITRDIIVCDPGYLFLTNRGCRIDPETVTQDFHRLKRAAGIQSKASGHMLRHRWITLQICERLNAYATKRLPLDIGTTLLTKVASLSGHALVSSLKPYLHLATEELAIWDQGGQNFDDRSERDAQDRRDHEDR